MKSKQLISAALVVAVAGLATTSVAMAKTKTYKVVATTGGHLDANLHLANGTANSKALGKCKQTGDFKPPLFIATWKCKGGTIKVVGTTTSGNANTVSSTVKINGGTGKYKGAKGKGTATGVIATGKFTYKFTMKVKVK
jgi:hypothetical protein